MPIQPTANKIRQIIELPDKRAVEKFCRDAVVTHEELYAAADDGMAGELGGYRYRRAFNQCEQEA